ncbi:MAG: DNA mismatch repair protein MutS [Anaerolineae bacterium]|uniref:DNA mismatch repair protein MutS n=1 Tax=Promineifilum sp. TaxID=2664178 RepID=UPI002411CC3E|nr:DNA mismatch repair protein MutS [Promineifilum sp.]MCW5846679.1 DNA mismatch repair protein MutS [Anaerolineae bacterium]
MSGDHVTPSRQQYLDIRAQHPDAIIFFRLGDFYETFDDDAALVARELDLVLTSRPQGKTGRVPMAGVPHHAAENYIARLVAKGYKVALCEQIGTDTVNGLMPREVVRVFTAGTVVEPGMLESGRNNYLAAVVLEDERAGLAYADITTGEFATTQLDSFRDLVEELARLSPVEILLPEAMDAGFSEVKTVSRLAGHRFELGNARGTLLRHFAVATLDAFGCEHKPLATRTAGALLHYLQQTQRGSIGQIQRLTTYTTDGYMALTESTRRNLELIEAIAAPAERERDGTLLATLNKTVTPMGARLLRRRITQPLLSIGVINERLDQVESLIGDAMRRAELRAALKGMPDLERLTNRVLSGRATPRDLEQIALALSAVGRVQSLVSGAVSLAGVRARLDPCDELTQTISRALCDDAPTNLNKSGFFRAGFSAELDGVVGTSAHAREWVAELEPRERERTGIASLKVGFNKVFGYYLEVTHANTKLVPSDYIRKQTLTNAERYITPELKEYETLILNAEERILQIERRLFAELSQHVVGYGDRLLATAAALAELDVAAALAEVAALNDYVRPRFIDGVDLHIENGRHPVVERALNQGQVPGAARGERFVPNDAHFADGSLIQIITGPNMSGKSTYLRQVALIVLMAQIGSYVPASSVEMGLVDRIFTRIGAHDELHAGRSTFMVEMVETAEILHHATHRSLLILDEIGRGTSTYDGLSLAWAIVEFLHNHPRLNPRTLFATHYHELTGLADFLPHVVNYNVDVSEEGGEVTFLHRIVPGGADRSYGIHVAQLAGLPRDVILRADEILLDLERHAPTATVEPSRLSTGQQIALFPEASPFLDELGQLDVHGLTPLQAINKLYEWKQRYTDERK